MKNSFGQSHLTLRLRQCGTNVLLKIYKIHLIEESNARIEGRLAQEVKYASPSFKPLPPTKKSIHAEKFWSNN